MNSRPFVLGLAVLLATGALAQDATGHVAGVIDGDMFCLGNGERIRIAEIDASETRGDWAKCPAEIIRGWAATGQAVALLKDKAV